MPLSKIQKKHAAYCETRIDDEVVLMNIDSGAFFALKGTGLAIWTLIDGERDLSAIQNEVLKRYSVSEMRCHAEVDSFLDAMVGAGLVERI